MDDELRKAVRDVLDTWDARLQVGMWAVTEEMEDLRAALAKNANAAPQEKGIRDILRDTVRSIIAAHSDGDLDVPLAIADLRAALANNANAAPSSDAEYIRLGKAMYEMTTTVHLPNVPFAEQCDLIPHVWKHFMDEANAAPQDQAKDAARPDTWDGAEEWERLAFELCAEECGEEACNELIWEGHEPWGDRWLKYEDEAKRMISLVRKHTAPVPAPQREWVGLTDEEINDCAGAEIYSSTWAMAFARAIESKLKEKNHG